MGIQYVIVFLILAAAVGWIIYKCVNKSTKPSGGCCGCALSQKCTKPEKGKKKD